MGITTVPQPCREARPLLDLGCEARMRKESFVRKVLHFGGGVVAHLGAVDVMYEYVQKAFWLLFTNLFAIHSI